MNRLVREGLQVGAVLAALNLLLWGVVILTTPPDAQALAWARALPRGQGEVGDGGAESDLNMCFHCPSFVLAGRGFVTGYEMPPRSLWLGIHNPTLRAAAAREGLLGVAEVHLGWFLVLVVCQWIVLGVVCRVAVHFLGQVPSLRAKTT